jgi:DNA-binding transcriptional LysR family regulator
MNLSHLRTFVIVADAGGFARASPHLNLSQSAASRQILALEGELGVSLFDRIGRRILLTSEGDDLLARGRRLLADIDAFSERALALKGGHVGSLRVSAAPQVTECLLAPFLPQYLRRHPGIEVRLIEGGGARQHDQLDRGEAHLALMSISERFHSRLLYPIHILAVLSRTHRLASRSVIEISDIAGEPLLVLRSEFGSRAWFDSACDVAHVDPRAVLESGRSSHSRRISSSRLWNSDCSVHHAHSSQRCPRRATDLSWIVSWSMVRRCLEPKTVSCSVRQAICTRTCRACWPHLSRTRHNPSCAGTAAAASGTTDANSRFNVATKVNV